jgi:UDP-2,3-diacylglucosamine pyrophosphatase LpxH
MGENLTVHREINYKGINGKEYLVTHGDMFDAVTMTRKWLALVGDKSYLFLLKINRPLNFIRRKMGLGHWSLSKYMKKNVKKAVSYICDYEQVLSDYAKSKNVHGVICGHIHEAEMKTIKEIEYLNCGDWVESCTAIVEHLDGRFEVYDASR